MFFTGERLLREEFSANPESASTAIAVLEAKVGARTDRGRVRENNEDRVLVFDLNRGLALATEEMAVAELQPLGVLLVVADGMGGMAAGEQASQLCIEQLPGNLLKRLSQANAASPPGRASREERRQALDEAVRQTHQCIYVHASADAGLRGMGTTLTAALLEENCLYVAQVGDSRAYLGRGSDLRQLTRDQTVWETFRQETQHSAPALGKAPWKNMLMQALGAQAEIQVAITETALEPGDWLLLCTDGLHRAVAPEEIGAVMAAESNPAEKAFELVGLANLHGGPDNVSVIVCQLANHSGPARRGGQARGATGARSRAGR